MTSELQKRLRALREIAPRLNNATDEANRIVGMVDNLLKELRLGISAQSHCFDVQREQIVDDDDGHVTDQETCRHLAYGRVQGSYGIHILETISQGPQGRELQEVDENRIPWSSCDRETRLEAFKELPGLLDFLLREATNVVGTAERTAEMIRDMTADDESPADAHSQAPAINLVESRGVQMMIVPVATSERGGRRPDGSFWCFVFDQSGNSRSDKRPHLWALLPVQDKDDRMERFPSWESAVEGGVAYSELWLQGKV